MDISHLHQDVGSLREIADRLGHSASELSAQDISALAEAAATLEQRFASAKAFPRDGTGDRFQDLVNSISDGLLTIDRDWRITFINQRAAQNGKFQPEELTGKNLWEMFPELLGTSLEKHYRQAMRERTAQHFEMKGVLQGLWYLISVYPSSEGISVFWINHTSTKQAELEQERMLAENRRQKALLDAIFEADPGGVAVVTGPDLRIVQVNPTYRFLIPNPFQDPVGQLYEGIWPRESGEWFSEQIRIAMETGQPFLATGVQLHLSIGITRTFTFQARRIDWQDEPAVLIILWDTSEQEKTNQALQESESRFMAIFQKAPLAIALSRLPNGNLVDVNIAFEKIFGFAKEEVIGRTTTELGIAPDPEAREQILNQFKGQGFVHHLELTYRTRTGESIVLSGNIDRVSIGDEAYILNTFENVTERKAAEARLAVEQEWFRTTLSSIGDAVITTDTGGRVTFLNPVAEQITGWSSIEAAGQPLEKVFPIVNEQTLRPVQNPVGKVLREGKIIGLANHTTLIQRSGRMIPIEDSAAPIMDQTGQMQGVVMVFHDVAEKRKSEQALRESEERFRLVLKNMPVVSAHLDRDLRYTWVHNPMLGFTASDIIGKKVGLSTDPQERKKLLQNLRGVVSTGKAAHWEVSSKTAVEEKFLNPTRSRSATKKAERSRG